MMMGLKGCDIIYRKEAIFLEKSASIINNLFGAMNDPEVKVVYVAGEGFFTEGGDKGEGCMRISFGSVAPEKNQNRHGKVGGTYTFKNLTEECR